MGSPAHGGLPHERTTDSEKKDDSENMDIPVMPHPGTDTQAPPYQSRQTKEPVPIVSFASKNSTLGKLQTSLHFHSLNRSLTY